MDENLAEFTYWGPWQIPVCCRHVLCSDGRRRYAKITGQPDTFFSIPASVEVKGKTVTGFITGNDHDDGQRDYQFHSNTYGKNGHLLP